MKIQWKQELPPRLQKYIDDWVNVHLSDLKYFVNLFYQTNWDEDTLNEHSPQVGFTIDISPSYPKKDGSGYADVFHLEFYTDDSQTFEIYLIKYVSTPGPSDMSYSHIAESKHTFDDWANLTINSKSKRMK